MSPRQFVIVTVLLTVFSTYPERSFGIGIVPRFLEDLYSSNNSKGSTTKFIDEEHPCDVGTKEEVPVQKKKVEHSICQKLYGESDGWCKNCAARTVFTGQTLDSLRQIIPWKPNYPCLLKSFKNFDLFHNFLQGIEALIRPCKNKLPTRSQCRANATFEGTLKESDYVSPKDWPCLRKAMNAEQFYVELQKMYKLVNPCVSGSPKLNLEEKNPSKLKNDKNVSLWVHALWWIWWYFMSGQVTFSLSQRDKPELKSTSYDDVLFNNAFDPKLPTKIVVHGFVNNHRSSIISMIRQAYKIRKNPKCRIDARDLTNLRKLKKPEWKELPAVGPLCNLIIVDWASMSYELYMMSRLRVLMVARQVTTIIRRLRVEYNMSLDSLELVGHSLGAQIVGITGNIVGDPEGDASRSSGKTQIAKITGLDPALPGYLRTPKKWRLSKDSGKFVQVIHTADYTFGVAQRLGHIDFYVNGGLPTQPGCGVSHLFRRDLRKKVGKLMAGVGQLRPINLSIICSHMRAIKYYVETIWRPKAFLARKCDNGIKFSTGLCNGNPTTYMGASTPQNVTPGSYYLNTAGKMPFGLGKKGI